MADDDKKEKSASELLQALDALSQLNQARPNRRTTTTSLALAHSGSGKDGADDVRAVDAAVKEARPRIRRRSSLTSPPSWSKPKLGKNDEALEGDDGALIIIIKSQGSSAEAARPQPRRRFSLMLPYDSRSKLDHDNEEEDDVDNEDWVYSAPLKNQGFAAATPEVDGEIMSWDPTRARSHVGMRRIGCLFSMDVVAALGLPQSMNGLRLAVTVRRKETRDGAVQTKPARVQLGAAYFDEALYVRCHLYGTAEPRPFLLSLVAVDAPELDFGRSTVDLSLFAKEFTDTCVRQWDMVFPLAGKAMGGELVVKLAIQSIDSQPAGEDKMSSKIRRSSEGHKVVDMARRKIRRSSVSNTLMPKMARTKTPKLDEEPEPEPTPTDEVKETQQEEPEREPADEPTSVAEVKEEEEQQKEPADEPTPVAELKEVEEDQKEPECEPADADEPTPVAEVKEAEQQKVSEHEPSGEPEPTPVVEVKEEEQQKEQEHKPADEEPAAPVAVVVVNEEEQQKELESEPADESTPVAEVKVEEQQNEQECEPADEPSPPVAVTVMNQEEQQKEIESEPADESTPVAQVKAETQQKEPEHEPDDDTAPVAEVEEAEEQQKEQECVPENVQEGDDDSELPELDGQQVNAELTKEESESMKRTEEESSLVAGDEVTKAVANGLEEKFVEATSPSDVSDAVISDAMAPVDAKSELLNEVTGESLQVPEQEEDEGAVADAVEPTDAKSARPEEVTGESLHVPEQGGKGAAAAKPPRRPRFKWRTVAVLVPVAVFFNKTLGVNR